MQLVYIVWLYTAATTVFVVVFIGCSENKGVYLHLLCADAASQQKQFDFVLLDLISLYADNR